MGGILMPTIDDFQRQIWAAQEADGGCDNDGKAKMGRCDGMGAITLNLAWGHPAFGRAFICICQRQAVLTRMINNTIQGDVIPDDSYSFDFEDFDHLPGAAQGLRYARQMVECGYALDDEGEYKRGLLLLGKPGCGKTTLISIIYRSYLTAGKSVGWWNAAAFVRRVQSAYATDYTGPSDEAIVKMVNDLDFVVFDDLGSPTRSDPCTESHIEITLRVVNHRWAKKLPTAFTSNCTRQQLEVQYGPRNYSRIEGLCAVSIVQGEDFRRAKGASNGK